MASKRKGQSDKLTGALPGWESQVEQTEGNSPPAPSVPNDKPSWNYKGPDAPDKIKRKTYLIEKQMIERIAETAEANQIGPNELVRFLLAHSLGELEAGTLALPLVQRNTLEY